MSPRSNICIVLGAGFSHAVSPQMPVTDELGRLALDKLSPDAPRVPAGSFANGNFEAWLSRLAEPQPDLRYDENLHNQAAFARISEAVREVLVERQTLVQSSPTPPWLERFLRVAHAARVTVISFNYDTILEAMVDGNVLIFDWDQAMSRVDSTDLVDGLPPIPQPPGSRFGKGRTDSFRLLKLHGSIDCWWVNGDASGATIVRTPGSWQEAADSYARQGAVPGRSPFLVPPAAAKSQFYRNPLTRELWQRAAAALQEATTVAFLGYSFPPTDLVTSGMVADRLGGRDVSVEVVDPCPAAPLESLRRLDIPAEASHESIEAYVDDLERRTAARAMADLHDLDGDLPLLVGTAEINLARVIAVHPERSGVRLVVEPFGGWSAATRPPSDGGDPPVTVAQLRGQLVEGSQLIVELSEGNDARVISWQHYNVSSGFRFRWVVGVLSSSYTF